MAHKLMLKEIGMDSMEILYYERQAKRKKAYISKRRKKSDKKKKACQTGQYLNVSVTSTLKEAI